MRCTQILQIGLLVAIDINQFWNILTESKLVGAAKLQSLYSQFSADSAIPKNLTSLTQFLVSQKAISPYQAMILSEGHSGPFRYGNYTVVNRIETGLMQGQFLARHTKTGYPVLLQFFRGADQSDLQIWQRIEDKVEQIKCIRHPNWVETFETVILPHHRFIVSQVPRGVALQEKLPRKARMPWKRACTLMAQVSYAVAEAHQQGFVHNAISPRTIWLDKSGLAQLRLNPLPDSEFEILDTGIKGSECRFDYLAPELITANEPTPESNSQLSQDLFSIGCTLYRTISGRPPFPETDLELKKQHVLHEPPASLQKLDLPTELDQLISKLVAKNPAERPASATEVANLLALISGKSNEIKTLAAAPSKARLAFRQSLTQFLPGADGPRIAAAPDIETHLGESEEPNEQSEERLAKIQAAALAIEKRKKDKWKVPAAVAAGLLSLSGLIAISAIVANRFVIETPKIPEEVATESIDPPEPEQTDPATKLAMLPPELRPTLFQQLIDDDDSSLWQSPTSGPPIEFSYLPAAPRILFALRPKEIVSTDEGLRVIKSLGPAFQQQIKRFQDRCGLDLINIERLDISLHSTDQFEYEPYFVVTTSQPIEKSRLMQNWNRPRSLILENSQEILESSDGSFAYYLLYDDPTDDDVIQGESEKAVDVQGSVDTTSDDTSEESVDDKDQVDADFITHFAMGRKELIEEVALSLGATSLSGALGNLASNTDRDRHVNILFLRNSLFNDEGQKLMGLENLALNRELRLMLPDQVRGGLVSFHLDNDCYCELMLDKNVDLKANELMTIMSDEFRVQRDQLMLFVARIPTSDYWDNVRIRYGGMLANFFQNLRWGVEHGQVVANCWLPPMAAHNLIAASEHVIAFSAGTSTQPTTVYQGPESLQELLDSKRDLNIANPPDLNVLMSDLRTEIIDDFGTLPFAFNIRLIGSDLEKEGITKNQRPSELVMNQKTLAEILTSIMIAANPAKDISGPSDPNCKLIWVIADDPENPGENAILITTRVAAEEKSYELPAPFRIE